jgi:hypothetical protein
MEVLSAYELRKLLKKTNIQKSKIKLRMYKKTYDEYLKQEEVYNKFSEKEKRLKKNIIPPILKSTNATLRTNCIKLFDEIMIEIKSKGEFYRLYFGSDFNNEVFQELKSIMEDLGYTFIIREDLIEEDALTNNSFGSFHYTKNYTKYTVIIRF